MDVFLSWLQSVWHQPHLVSHLSMFTIVLHVCFLLEIPRTGSLPFMNLSKVLWNAPYSLSWSCPRERQRKRLLPAVAWLQFTPHPTRGHCAQHQAKSAASGSVGQTTLIVPTTQMFLGNRYSLGFHISRIPGFFFSPELRISLPGPHVLLQMVAALDAV